jgi:exosortase D (VPLPA-CTERM-specific)
MTVESSSLSGSEPASAGRHAPRSSSSVYWVACVVGAAVALIALLYHQSVAYLFQEWMENEDSGHGLFVPFIALALIWWRREQLLAVGSSPTWWGLLPVGLGVALFIVGELATLYVLQHLSLWCVLVGLVLSIAGFQATRQMAFPLGYLLAAIPPPHMVQQSLSSSLQLISSALGVGWLQLIGVTAFRDGNVIDLGPIQLQVVEACSGLRYLFPLLALTVLCAYLFQDRMWKRVVLVASTAPLAVLLNGLRIGLIGVLVEHFGKGAAEGFMHLFEGWFLFMLSLALLGMELWLLGKIGAGAQGTNMPRSAEERRPSPVMTPFSSSVSGPGLACAGVLAAAPKFSRFPDAAGREEWRADGHGAPVC